MKVVAWNVRGAGLPLFVSQVRKLVKNTTPDILFLFETRINANRTMNILPKLPFECYDIVDPVGFLGGLWLCWNSSIITLNIIF